MIPVKGHSNLFRDENTNAIINTDKTAYQTYINNRRVNSDKQFELDEMKKEIEELKSLLNNLASKITS
tara:strand:- start:750 stop:953 length:204 start_codon:yes stop_codon:yes gene_type:complete